MACNQGPRPTKLPDCMKIEPDQLCVPAPLSNHIQFVWQAAKPTPSRFFMPAQLAQSETAVKGQLPIYFFGHLALDPRDWSILRVFLL